MMKGDHPKCARTCVKNGAQYALVVGAKVYPMKGHPEEADELVGEKVEVTGDLVSADPSRSS